MHQGRGDAAYKNLVGLAVRDVERETDRLRDLRVLEREQGGDVDASPRLGQHRSILALDEPNPIPLALRPVVLGDLHQAERWVLVLVARLDEQDVLVSH